MSVDTMQTKLGIAARRRMLVKVGAVSLVLAVASLLGNMAHGQLAVPKYQSPIQAPKPQTPTLPAPAAVTPNGTVVEYPIVRVNDQIIDNSDYDRAAKDLDAEVQRNNIGPEELAQREKDLLRDMIDQQLLLSRGKELDVNADAEVIRRLDEIRKQNHLDSMDDLEKAVRESGLSFEDFKSNIKNGVVTQEVVRDEVGRNLRLTAKDEQTYYDQHKQQYAQPEHVSLTELLIPTPDDATDAQVTQAQAKADQIETQLKAGAKFEDLVKQYSGGPNPETGGELGDFCRTGSTAPQQSCSQLGSKLLDDPVFALKAGEWTAPIRTRQGFIILKVTDHNMGGIPPLSAVDEQVQEAIYAQAIQPALRAYLTKLREDAYIDVAPGFTDTGASPKQTKPVFSGATPPPVKKKKTEVKARLAPSRPAAAIASKTSPPATSAAATSAPGTKTVSTGKSRKAKKIRREKIRYGQAPRESLPSAPEETLAPGADQGPGAASSTIPAPGEAIAPLDQTTTLAANTDPLGPAPAERKKTRYSDRAATETKTKAVKKVAKAQEKIKATPAPLTQEDKLAQATQDAPLGLSGDTATKKKHKRVKGAPKECIQQKAPTPPAPKPDATPIPPKSVRENGEPAVTPAPANPSPATAPAGTATPPATQQ